jgi:hypothetical protein
MREDIGRIFSDYRQSFKLKWGRIIHAGFEKIVPELEAESMNYRCIQKVENSSIIWYDKDNKIQAMFCFPQNAKDFESIFMIFKEIRNKNSPLTFIFIHQESDGTGNYDIFRISEKSYLEHNNRVRFRNK